MYIIDRNRDYYDFHSHIYGVDKSVVFDRRNSIILDDKSLGQISGILHYSMRNKDKSFVLLEVGNTQYLIMLYDIVFYSRCTDVIKSYSIKVVRTFKDNKNRFGTPLSITGVDVAYTWRYGEDRHYKTEESFNEVVSNTFNGNVLPILRDTKITSLIDSHDIWVELQTYISSLGNDKDVELKMTDKERAGTHGFDKNSFRNPIK